MKRGLAFATAIVAGLGLAVALDAAFPHHAPALGDNATLAPPADILDAPAANVRLAALNVTLVTWGTSTPYGGTGPPGVDLNVATMGSITDWTLEAWANDTTAPPVRACTSPTVHFSPYDWAFQNQQGATGTRGTFISTPSTVLQRVAPTGDQCLLRVQARGVWHVRVCVEGKTGGPRGIYDAPDGRHRDDWDRCIDQDFQVP